MFGTLLVLGHLDFSGDGYIGAITNQKMPGLVAGDVAIIVQLVEVIVMPRFHGSNRALATAQVQGLLLKM